MTRVRLIDQIAIAALIGLATYLLFGDFGVRLANTSTDDGLVAYAYLVKYPERFLPDVQLVNWGSAASASILNWLPAVLFKYLDLPPEVPYWLFAFLQNILLALAVFRLAITMTRSREAAWLAALFTLAFRPHWWNLGLFADADWMPYGTWLALPFLVYAGAFALERRPAGTALALLIGGLVHPVLGLFAATMVGAYWVLLGLREKNIREPLVRSALLGAVVISFLLPAVLAKLGIEEAPPGEILSMILKNGHTIPWNNPGCGYCMPFFLRALVFVPTMTVLALLAADRETTHPNLRLFLLACALVAFAACLLHVIAYFVGSATILRVVSFRATILLLVFSVPSVIALAWRQFRNAAPLVRLLAGYLIVLPSPAALLAALLVLPGSARLRHAPSGTAAATLRVCHVLGAALFVLLLARHVPKLGPRVDIYLLERVFDPATIPLYFGYQTVQFPWFSLLAAAFLCMVAAWQWLAMRRGRAVVPAATFAPPAWALAAWVVVYLLTWNRDSGQQATTGEAREYYEVQAWARDATPPDASFIVVFTSIYEGWRNFTHRPRIMPHNVCGFYVCSHAARAYDEKIAEFYARQGKVGYMNLDTKGLREFARAFGGDYVVRRKTWAPFVLPVAFENSGYVVYDLR